MHTQVVIIGAGPAGLLLSQVLHVNGISSIIVEAKDRRYVEARIRAGILEQGTVDLLRRAGAADRLDREALIHKGVEFSLDGERRLIDFRELIGGRTVTLYGQTEVVKDLIQARSAAGGDLRFEASRVAIHDIETARPRVTFEWQGRPHEITADFIAGCDGFHGVCRASLPASRLNIFERVYPFAWLGILAEAPPVADELIYARHERGFALFSMRSRKISRHYIQCAVDTNIDLWPDEKIWDELATRLGPDGASAIVRGRVIDKGVTPMRSFVAEPMRHGRLFLAGDAAHIVPPTGAKGLNLAAGDIHYLSEALIAYYRSNSMDGLDGYSTRALARVWKAQRFSWWLTSMLHVFGAGDPFEDRVRRAELAYVLSSRAALETLAENYVGLPY
jgi:p-hydroxybenzoate 3-monooxygenase